MQEKSVKKILLILCVGATSFGYSQLQYSMNTFSDANGNPVVSKKVVLGESSFLYNNNYLDAVVYMPTGKPIIGNKFKLNLQENKLYYIDETGIDMEVVSPVKRVEFGNGDDGAKVVFEKGFPPIGKLTADNFYQVLVAGKASLLLDTKFDVVEYKEYNSALTTRRTDKLITFYGVSPGGIVRISKPEDVIQLLTDKSKQVSGYMLSENSKVKKQADLEKIFRYYNSLK